MTSRASAADITLAVDVLRRLLAAIEAHELDATPEDRARLEGALVALAALAEGDRPRS